MDLAVNSDYVMDRGSAEKWFQPAADAGFTHIFWGHHWILPFLYGPAEMKAIASWYRKSNLKIRSIHGAAECEKGWWSTEEYQRQSGVELVINRLELLNSIEGDGPVVMHVPRLDATKVSPEYRAAETAKLEAVMRSLDELIPVFERAGRRLALENLHGDSGEFLTRLMETYPAAQLGLCFDTGHANIRYQHYHIFEKFNDRIYALHLHDNDGLGDWHQPPFIGDNIQYRTYDDPTPRCPQPGVTIDWDRVAKIVRNSPCREKLTFELTMRTSLLWNPDLSETAQPMEKVQEFLNDAYIRCCRFAEMVEKRGD